MELYDIALITGGMVVTQAMILGGMLSYYKLMDFRGQKKYHHDMELYKKGKIQHEPNPMNYLFFSSSVDAIKNSKDL